MHSQIGVDDSSADLDLRGLPVFRGLIGPIPEGKNIVRYESPEVFETVTKEWSSAKIKRRRRRKSIDGEMIGGEVQGSIADSGSFAAAPERHDGAI